MSDPVVSVIIVNYNSGHRLEKCLAHLVRQTVSDFETIIIDNASTDASMDAARRLARETPEELTIIDAGDNLGFAAANNKAAQGARGTWLAFLNPDAYARPDWIEKLLDAAKRYPSADAFGSTQIDAADETRLDGAGDVLHAFGLPYRGYFGWPAEAVSVDAETFSACAAAALYRRSTFDALGGFDERFFCYGEDVDLGYRLRLAGGRCIQVASAVVAHEGSGV
ncbi:MAG: glycosyltransferase family 2 protein, partial [Pseudomonadota bacterium]